MNFDQWWDTAGESLTEEESEGYYLARAAWNAAIELAITIVESHKYHNPVLLEDTALLGRNDAANSIERELMDVLGREQASDVDRKR